MKKSILYNNYVEYKLYNKYFPKCIDIILTILYNDLVKKISISGFNRLELLKINFHYYGGYHLWQRKTK
jgi:hypothetical protein